jgi:hypothetical protein
MREALFGQGRGLVSCYPPQVPLWQSPPGEGRLSWQLQDATMLMCGQQQQQRQKQ